MATIIEVTNPFDRSKDIIKQLNPKGLTIIGWLNLRFHEFTEFTEPTICLINGVPTLRKDWEYIIQDTDIITFVRLAPRDAGIVFTALALFTVATAYYVSNIPKPSSGNLREADSVYSLTGQANKIKLMQPIEVSYGRVRMWPSYAAKPFNRFSRNDQYLYALFCLGNGYFEVENIQVEDTLVSNFNEVTASIREPGESPQLFPTRVITSAEVAGIELYGPNEPKYTEWTGPFTVNAAGTQITRIEVDFSYPSGLYYSNDNGGLDNVTVTSEFEYRKIDDNGDPLGAWTELFTESTELRTVNPIRRTKLVLVTAGRYEVRGRRTNAASNSARVGDTLMWSSLRGLRYEHPDYGDVTLMEVVAKATNNLNDNAANKFNVIATRKIPKWHPDTGWSAPVATRSIVWAFCDIFRASYGAGLADSYLNLEELYQLDLFYEGRGEYFDYIFDQRSTVWEAAKTIARVGRAVPMLIGSQITMVRDSVKTLPTAVFNQENIIKDSFRWDVRLFEQNEKDSVLIEYLDPVTWNPQEILCALEGSEGLDPEKIKLAGCSNRDHAFHEGMYIAASNYYIRENITFRTGLEGYLPNYGDLISVSHDLPRWGQSGYVKQITGSLVELSDPVTFQDGNNYIVFRKNDGSAAGPYQVTDTGNPFYVLLVDTIDDEFYFDGYHEPPLYQFGSADGWSKLCKIVNIRPSSRDEVEITCTNYDARVHGYDLTSAPAESGDNIILTPDLPIAANLWVQVLPDTNNFVLINWATALGATSYIIQKSYDGTNWDTVDNIVNTSYTLSVVKGYLYLRVAGINKGAGPWTYWEGNVGEASGPPNNVLNLMLQQPFIGTFAKIQWYPTFNATSYQVGVYKDGGSTLLRTIEVTSTSYTYSYENAVEDGAGTRDYQFQLNATNALGDSDTATILNVSNPSPNVPENIVNTLDSEDANEAVFIISWEAILDTDLSGYRVWASATTGFTPGPSNLIYDGQLRETSITIAKTVDSGGGLMVTPPYYFVVAAYDIWDDAVNYSTEQTIAST